MAGSILSPGEALLPGASLNSFSGLVRLQMEAGGDLVLSHRAAGSSDWSAYWTSGTSSRGVECTMAENGELLIGYPGSPAVWSSGTAGHANSYLVVQDDGSLVIYEPRGVLWATGTNVPPPVAPGPPAGPSKGDRLGEGQRLAPGEQLVSPNSRYRMTMQTDGNLVLYDVDSKTWASNTNGHPVIYLEMQTDANLVVYGPGRSAVWASNTDHHGTHAFLVVQDDGNAVIYATVPTWAKHAP